MVGLDPDKLKVLDFDLRQFTEKLSNLLVCHAGVDHISVVGYDNLSLEGHSGPKCGI
jgi:hypothetical protein